MEGLNFHPHTKEIPLALRKEIPEMIEKWRLRPASCATDLKQFKFLEKLSLDG